jgi:glycosyltransferase involved in cell wall biosynthesis
MMKKWPVGMPAEPRVSVILPTYNRGWILVEAVESVLGQDYANLELIVVDDGSTDNTKGLLLSFEDRITVIRQANRGVSAARNAGIRAATGELLALLDSDDTWLPGKSDRPGGVFLDPSRCADLPDPRDLDSQRGSRQPG